MSRKFRFVFEIECGGPGTADEQRVEEMLDLVLKDLLDDDDFIAALDEKVSVAVQLIPLNGVLANQNQNNG